MKSKIFFWSLVSLVFGGLIALGIVFYKTNLTLFLITEGITILALILFVVLYIRLIRPYQIILSGVDFIKGQDFSTSLRQISNSEANKLILVFNKMMEQLRNERLSVREKNQFLDLLLQASPQGVIILDFDENITSINPAGIKLLDLESKNNYLGKQLKDLDSELCKSLANLKQGDDVIIRNSGISMFRCIRTSFIDRGFSHPFILVEELTREILKTEKKSYENIIRMMAHEVNNSVGAIGSTLDVISDTINSDNTDTLDEILPAIKASSERCLNLGSFIKNFSQVVKIPLPVINPVKLNELARTVFAFAEYECKKKNINLIQNLNTDEDFLVNIDIVQFEQVLVNIVKNSYESIKENGEIIIETKNYPPSISIIDNGPGISDEVKGKLFTPFFTTKSTGQGIGLLFVREVLFNHNLKFDFRTEDGITKFIIYF
ncbi:PAS domain-containing protein [Bacteroidales bacterium OttesenSCG-928-K03]|nr:PAS domain-containing protein [Odoribacter sp. OttesenSCG-928-L07]MDL2242289.1 PAS domain-containing protein [Bacteroidales bacterium OttesenSCG-928-K03]